MIFSGKIIGSSLTWDDQPWRTKKSFKRVGDTIFAYMSGSQDGEMNELVCKSLKIPFIMIGMTLPAFWIPEVGLSRNGRGMSIRKNDQSRPAEYRSTSPYLSTTLILRRKN
ncbi:MAG: hypothetical protein C3F07_12160 [Anaerolineales bacterium]|nr:MAG: hypothetical protein C3F07_12160 [Anaerolineales bacterium]